VVNNKEICALCGLDTNHPIYGKNQEPYCCHSCSEIAILLAEDPLPEKPIEFSSGNQTEITMSVGGMWCSSCAWLVEEKLKREKGVQNAQISFVQRKAKITFNDESTNVKKLIRSVNRFGYKASLKEEDLEEEDRFETRMMVGGVVASHIMMTSLIMYFRELTGLATPEAAWLEHIFFLMQFVASILLFLILGLPILRAGIVSFLRGVPNIQSLVTLGSLAAFGISVRNLFFVEAGHVYFDTAAMLLFLVTIGRWLEMRAHHVSKSAIDDLLNPVADTVLSISKEGETPKNVSELKMGNRIRIFAGEFFPADGRIASGEGEVDESLLTGEPRPIHRKQNDSVFAGTKNLDGEFDVIVSKTGEHTKAGLIQKLLLQAMWQRSPIERLADRLAARMVWGAIVVASLTFIGWYPYGFETALLNTLSVLLIACPCALGLATPLTLWQAIGHAAQKGILLRSTAVLERLTKVREIFYDKTGTLSIIPMQLQEVYTERESSSDLLYKVAAVEKYSEHPFSNAILSACKDEIPSDWKVENYKSIPGWGISGELNGEKIIIGSGELMQRENFAVLPIYREKSKHLEENGYVVIFVGWDGNVQGLLGIGETIRPEITEVIENLGNKNYSQTVLTGDTLAAGKRWNELLNIPVKAGLKPEDKLKWVEGRDEGTLMIGDGINDGPALAKADVGVTLQSGADIAQSAAEITLLNNDLRGLPWLLELANETNRRLKINLVWAATYNIIGVGLAVAGLLQPVIAAFAMILSSLIVTRNALQIRKFPDWDKDNDQEDHSISLKSYRQIN
jgi:P-type Cu+ transporter